MREAAEQSERLTLPVLHTLQPLETALDEWNSSNPFLACLERYDAQPMAQHVTNDDTAILIGPVGGFTEDEKNQLAARPYITPVSLGDNVLRCETAVIVALAVIQSGRTGL